MKMKEQNLNFEGENQN